MTWFSATTPNNIEKFCISVDLEHLLSHITAVINVTHAGVFLQIRCILLLLAFHLQKQASDRPHRKLPRMATELREAAALTSIQTQHIILFHFSALCTLTSDAKTRLCLAKSKKTVKMATMAGYNHISY